MHALDAYKRANGRMFPTCSEILEVVRDLGYIKQELRPEELEQLDSTESSDGEQPVAQDVDGVPTEETDFELVESPTFPSLDSVDSIRVEELTTD